MSQGIPAILARLEIGLTDSEALARQGFVAAEYRSGTGGRRGPYYKLRWRCGGRQRVRYLGRDAEFAEKVRDVLHHHQRRVRTRARLRKLARRARARLRQAKSRLAPLLAERGLYFHGYAIRRRRWSRSAKTRGANAPVATLADGRPRRAPRGSAAGVGAPAWSPIHGGRVRGKQALPARRAWEIRFADEKGPDEVETGPRLATRQVPSGPVRTTRGIRFRPPLPSEPFAERKTSVVIPTAPCHSARAPPWSPAPRDASAPLVTQQISLINVSALDRQRRNAGAL